MCWVGEKTCNRCSDVLVCVWGGAVYLTFGDSATLRLFNTLTLEKKSVMLVVKFSQL